MIRPALAAVLIIIFTGRSFTFNYNNSIISPIKPVRSYKTVQYCLKNNPSIIITREFLGPENKTNYYYINTGTLQYGLTDEWKEQDMTAWTNAASSNAMFFKLMKIQLDRKLPFGNSAEKFPAGSYTNLVLTSDLCPANPRYARLFYDSISNFNSQAGTNIPLILFFSGKWIEKHSLDLEKIKSYPFSFTAGNHSYRHIILTNSHTSGLLTAEVTNNERVMLENGLLPSYIFRFPGFKHSREDIRALSSINILALDANVWMGNKIRNWKILLVHSNGNAAPEVQAFSRFLTNNADLFKEKKIVFRDVFDYFQYVASMTNN